MTAALITSVRLAIGPANDRLFVFNRRGGAGILTVKLGDGDAIARRLVDDGRGVETKTLGEGLVEYAIPWCPVCGAPDGECDCPATDSRGAGGNDP